MGGRDTRLLIDQHQELVSKGLDTRQDDDRVEEEQIKKNLEKTARVMISHEESAKGIRYRSHTDTHTWRPLSAYRTKSKAWCDLVRQKYSIQIQSELSSQPPPAAHF